MAWTTAWLRNTSLGLTLLVAVVAASTPVSAEPTRQSPERPLGDLEPLRWQHRIILVDGRVPDAIARLRAEQPAIDERHVVWFVLAQGQVQSNYPGPLGPGLAAALEQQHLSQSDAAVLLIGKDGGIKARANDLDLAALFERIDAMPMRRREMEAAQ